MKKITSLHLLAATWGVGLAMIMGQAGAQPPGTSNNDKSRQERIREHQDRIQKIIEESRKRREEQQASNAQQATQNPPSTPGNAPGAGNNAAGSPLLNAAGQAPQAARPGQALPTGPVQNQRLQPPIQKAQATPQPQGPQSARSESRTILMFHPLDSIVDVGERFQTDVVAETKEGEIDEFSLFIKYPRHLLNPLAMDHKPIDSLIDSKLDYEFDPDQGTIYLHAKLKTPTRFMQKPMVSFIWEALEPTDGSVISYEFGEKKTTGLFLKGTNLLGTLPGADDGVIRTTVQILEPKTKPTVTKLQDKGLLIGEVSRAIEDDRPEDVITLQLQAQKASVKAGETFDVAVLLKNPGEKLIDRVQLYLQFDPDQVEVVDSDIGNVATKGINIHDAKGREEFPFDYNRYNYADNEKGLIVYDVSASNSKVRGTGQLATIKLKALKETPRTDLVLVRNTPGSTPTSDVSYLGASLLNGTPGEQARALDGESFRVSGQVQTSQAFQGEPAKVFNPFASPLAQRMHDNTN